jgi:hypothetical protein
MAGFSNLVKGVIEAWWTDISSLVNPTDSLGNAVAGPVRAQVTANIPVTGSIQKSTAGAAAPDQTLFQLSGTAALNVNSTPTTITSVNSDGNPTTFTTPTGKTSYFTDIIYTGNAALATPQQVEILIKAGSTVIFRGWMKTDTQPLVADGIETQPQAAGNQAITFVVNGNGTVATTVDWFLSGFSQ